MFYHRKFSYDRTRAAIIVAHSLFHHGGLVCIRNGFLGYRNFYMEDAAGESITYANSMWTLIDTGSMRPKKPTQDMIDGYVFSKKLEMEYAPRKIELSAKMKAQQHIVIRKHHLDTNDHVNNGEYVKMALDVMPMDFRVKELRAEYKKSAVLGNILYGKYIKREWSA